MLLKQIHVRAQYIQKVLYLRVNTRPCDSFNKYIQATKDKIKSINRDI